MLAKITSVAAVSMVLATAGWAQVVAVEEAKLVAGDQGGFGLLDYFGRSVSFSGDTALVGAYGDDHVALSGGNDAGAAYAFVRSGSTWIEQAKLTASDPGWDDGFGYSVAVSGDTAVIGAPFDDHPVAYHPGSAYVFVRSGSTWVEQAKLTVTDIASSAEFGGSVAVAGDTAVVGAPWENQTGAGFPAPYGVVYVFERSGSSWNETARLVPQIPVSDPFGTADQFGASVATSLDTILVGAPGQWAGGLFYAGAVYAFVRDGASWDQQQRLTASAPVYHAAFGEAVSLSGETALIGAPGDLPLGAGSARVFVRTGEGWTEHQKLTASDGEGSDQFGGSVAVSGDYAVVGAPLDDAGSAYLFTRSGTTWSEQQKLTASDGSFLDSFGYSVSMSSDTIVAGTRMNVLGPPSGAAYAFRFGACQSSAAYCSAGVSASGCQATLCTFGSPSASASTGFVIHASGVEGAKDGLFFFGTNGRQANPWGNGTSYQCVVPPVTRTGLLSGPGTIGLCDGTLALDLNALWCPTCPKPAKNPGPGATVQAQLWYRDPASTSNQTTSLSDAIEFVVSP